MVRLRRHADRADPGLRRPRLPAGASSTARFRRRRSPRRSASSSSQVEKGKAVFEGVPEFRHYNPIGIVHGGFAMTLLDSCMACAIQTTLAKGEIYTTLEVKVNLVRAITKDTGLIRATGRLIHRGRTTATRRGRHPRRRRQPARARHHDVHDFPGEEMSVRRRQRRCIAHAGSRLWTRRIVQRRACSTRRQRRDAAAAVGCRQRLLSAGLVASGRPHAAACGRAGSRRASPSRRIWRDATACMLSPRAAARMKSQ